MNRISLPGRILLFGAILVLARSSGAQPIDVHFCWPTLDRWMYPYNTENGCQPDIAVFGGLTTDGVFDPMFDNRDAQMLIGFNTSVPEPAPELCPVSLPEPCDPSVTPVAAGQGPDNYYVTWARVTVTVLSDLTFAYDPTPDPWQSWLPPADPDYVPDPDPGRPVELFGTAFRHGWSASTFPENGPYCDNCNCFPPNICKMTRSAFPTDAATCGVRDISNNVDDRFDAVPFAVGVNDTLTPGQLVPKETELTFDIQIGDDCIQDYLQASLDEGMLDFVIASIFPAEQQQEGTYPKFFSKENLLVVAGFVEATRLDMTVLPGPHGDIDGDGVVGIDDFLAILGLWGPCDEPCPPTCLGDLDGDCQIGITDFLIVIGNWTL